MRHSSTTREPWTERRLALASRNRWKALGGGSALVILCLFSLAAIAQQGTPDHIDLVISELKPYGSTLYIFPVKNDFSPEQIEFLVEMPGNIERLITLTYPHAEHDYGGVIPPGNQVPVAVGVGAAMVQSPIPQGKFQGAIVISAFPVRGKITKVITIPVSILVDVPIPRGSFSTSETGLRFTFDRSAGQGARLGSFEVRNDANQTMFFQTRVWAKGRPDFDKYIALDYERSNPDVAPASSPLIRPGASLPIWIVVKKPPPKGEYDGMIEIEDAFGRTTYVPLQIVVTYAEGALLLIVFAAVFGGGGLVALVVFIGLRLHEMGWWKKRLGRGTKLAGKKRVYEVAKELGVHSNEILKTLRSVGIHKKSWFSILSDNEVQLLTNAKLRTQAVHREIKDLLLKAARKDGLLSQEDVMQVTEGHDMTDVLAVIRELQEKGVVKKESGMYIFPDFID